MRQPDSHDSASLSFFFFFCSSVTCFTCLRGIEGLGTHNLVYDVGKKNVFFFLEFVQAKAWEQFVFVDMHLCTN